MVFQQFRTIAFAISRSIGPSRNSIEILPILLSVWSLDLTYSGTCSESQAELGKFLNIGLRRLG